MRQEAAWHRFPASMRGLVVELLSRLQCLKIDIAVGGWRVRPDVNPGIVGNPIIEVEIDLIEPITSGISIFDVTSRLITGNGSSNRIGVPRKTRVSNSIMFLNRGHVCTPIVAPDRQIPIECIRLHSHPSLLPSLHRSP